VTHERPDHHGRAFPVRSPKHLILVVSIPATHNQAFNPVALVDEVDHVDVVDTALSFTLSTLSTPSTSSTLYGASCPGKTMITR
jgi:hypothetical protein